MIDDLMCPRIDEGTAEYEWMTWQEIAEQAPFAYLRPGTIREDLICDDAPLRHPPYDVVPINTTMSTATGVLASATKASAEKGKLLAGRISEHIVGILETEFPASTAASAQDPASAVANAG